MFVRSKKLAEVYEQRIADLKEASEQRHAESLRVIKALADEVEYLRAQHFGRDTRGGVTPANVQVLPEREFMVDPNRSEHYISEEEEDLKALRNGGFIDASEYDQALQQLRAATGGAHISFDGI
jgi:hypothetical protein